MKKLHLLCNAHIDPIWMWVKEEGILEALSTYRVAADFCEEYPDFVFNHNESVLYEWVEQFDPPLFERIRKLVADGRWRVIGGAYLQPDCNMPSGEAMVRQLLIGRKYFLDKFGVAPRTAVNFDSFGHSRGLAQILKNRALMPTSCAARWKTTARCPRTILSGRALTALASSATVVTIPTKATAARPTKRF